MFGKFVKNQTFFPLCTYFFNQMIFNHKSLFIEKFKNK